MGILATYNEFKSFEPAFEKWRKNKELTDEKTRYIVAAKPFTNEAAKEQERAKILVNTLTSIDEYAQTKAEDIDSVSQTLSYIFVGMLGGIGTYIGKKASRFVKNPKIAAKLPTVTGIGFALATFLPFVRMTVKNQVRANRIARFESMHEKSFTTNDFALLTPEQKKQAEENTHKIPDELVENNNSIINRADIFNSISVFKEFTMKQWTFDYLKQKHDKGIADDMKKVKNTKFSDEEIAQSRKDQKLFNKVLQNVDMAAHYPLEKVEKGINVLYSSLFAGGVLEYVVSDGLLNLFKVKNKIVRPVLSWGLPVLTIMSLNKQLANLLNDSVKAIRHKKMNEYLNNPDNFKECDESEVQKLSIPHKEPQKQGYFEFIKQTMKDIDDYKKYQEEKRIEEKKYTIAKRNIKLTPKQKSDAELLKRNTEIVINKLDDQTQKYATAMETITESTTIPLDIMSPIIGSAVAGKLQKTFCPQSRFNTLFKCVGAIVAFIPAALSEIYFVGQQRQAKRCATLIASNNLQNSDMFLNPKQKELQTQNRSQNNAFRTFKNDLQNFCSKD